MSTLQQRLQALQRRQVDLVVLRKYTASGVDAGLSLLKRFHIFLFCVDFHANKSYKKTIVPSLCCSTARTRNCFVVIKLNCDTYLVYMHLILSGIVKATTHNFFIVDIYFYM
jgi:hypothetical protein